ncbi:MAG: hypothetical protein WAX66_04325 [Patescibacteria group bacterium]
MLLGVQIILTLFVLNHFKRVGRPRSLGCLPGILIIINGVIFFIRAPHTIVNYPIEQPIWFDLLMTIVLALMMLLGSKHPSKSSRDEEEK